MKLKLQMVWYKGYRSFDRLKFKKLDHAMDKILDRVISLAAPTSRLVVLFVSCHFIFQGYNNFFFFLERETRRFFQISRRRLQTVSKRFALSLLRREICPFGRRTLYITQYLQGKRRGERRWWRSIERRIRNEIKYNRKIRKENSASGRKISIRRLSLFRR